MAALEAEIVTTRPPVYRDYTAEFKAELLVEVQARGGNVEQVANAYGVPRKTLEYWIATEERYGEFRRQKHLDLATKHEANLHRLTDSVADQDLTEVPFIQKVTAIGILTDKMQLLRGQPTSIVQTENITSNNVLSMLCEALDQPIDITPSSE